MPGTPGETSALEHEVRIAARPETVFGYFTDPARMVEWMGAEATLDPRPGGICRIAFRPAQATLDNVAPLIGLDPSDAPAQPTSWVMSGRFVDVDPPHRIALTWGWEQEVLAVPPQSTAVEVSLTPDGDETILRLVHRRVPAAMTTYHRFGWEHYLPRLALAAAGEPLPDPWQAPAD
jgi:uncharacterized protein YndB with AHSA1/START domain